MRIGSVGANVPVAGSDSGDVEKEIQQLERQKQALKSTLKQGGQSKEAEVLKKIQKLDERIQKLRQQSSSGNQSVEKADETRSKQLESTQGSAKGTEIQQLLSDTYEPYNDQETLDNTYRLIQEEGKTKVKFNRLRNIKE